MKTPNEIRQAIQTRFRGPTDTKGSRVIASCRAGRLVFDWDHRLNSSENHRAAAERLHAKLDWNQRNILVGGALKNGDYVFVQVE